MSFPLHGGVAVLTGAAGGIGAALADSLAGRGCALALVDRDAAGLAAVAARARARGVAVSEHVLDLTQPAAIAALPAAVLDRHGRVSLLVNNAGVALMGRFDQVALADMEWLFAINFWAPVRMTAAFLPLLRREGTAQIVNLSSVYGLIAPPGQAAYAASKFALRGFSESLRHELEGSGIGVCVVHPGGVRTGIAASARVPPTIGRAEAEAAVATFSRLLRTAPEAAAARIVAGIERCEPRILIGGDARWIELLQRLMPVRHWRVIRRQAERMMRRNSTASAGEETAHG